MPRLSYKKIEKFIAEDVIRPFYQNRFNRLQKLNLKDIVRRKNTY
jgi:alanine-alpha-ketoisovalerate/valine-pyruvate aminotransferase